MIFVHEPVAHELVWNPDIYDTRLLPDNRCVFKPGAEICLRQAGFYLKQAIFPQLLCIHKPTLYSIKIKRHLFQLINPVDNVWIIVYTNDACLKHINPKNEKEQERMDF